MLFLAFLFSGRVLGRSLTLSHYFNGGISRANFVTTPLSKPTDYLKQINPKRLIRNIQERGWPKRKQWLQLPKVLNCRERWLAGGLILAILISVVLLGINFYLNRSHIEPEIGGQYREGILGQPRYINPVLAQTNDTDRDLVRLIYSSLFKYNGQGELIPDLAESYALGENGLVYDIFLKENLLWHDGEPLTADDLIFTIRTIQNPEYKSPLRNNWQSVEIEKIDQRTVRFKLKNAYAPFLHNLTVGILPKHLWAGISAQNFPLALYNLKPVGSGPYKFKESTRDEAGKIESITLTRFKDFYLTDSIGRQGPFIKEFVLKFYDNQDGLIKDYRQRKIDGLSFISPANLSELKAPACT